MGGYVKVLGSFTRADVVEALGVREALSWIKDRGQTKVIIETDCLRVVQAMRSRDVDFSHFGLIIQDCTFILATLRDVKVVFVRRSANSVAHTLVRAAVSMSGFHVWGYTPPDCIASLLHADLI